MSLESLIPVSEEAILSMVLHPKQALGMVLGKFIKSMKKDKIAIIGLGYVGLPLARLFATKFSGNSL